MNIAVKKVELIEWLATLQDQTLLDKVENIRKQAIKEAYESSLKPMSSEAYKSMLNQAEEDFKQGKITSQDNLEKESENW